jgi:Protein of unknown function (DUF1573)
MNEGKYCVVPVQEWQSGFVFMRFMKSIAVAASVLLIIVTGWNVVYWFGPPAWGPRLICKKPVADLGNVLPGTTVEHTFFLENTGLEDVNIETVIHSCSCLATNCNGVRIPSGQGISLPVKVTIRDTVGRIEEMLAIKSNVETQPVLVLRLRCTIVAREK